MNHLKKKTIGTALLICFLLISGVVSAEEMSLRMLIWDGYAPAELCSTFKRLIQEKYGINLELDIKIANGNDDFFPALRDSTADIISPSHNVPKDKRWQLIALKQVLPINLENVPNYKNIIPALQKADYCTEDGFVYCVPHIRGPYGLAYNTNLVASAPDSWSIFWASEYKGKYAVGGADQYEHNVSLTALAMGIPREKIYDYKTLNNPDFQEKLAQLAVNAHGLWQGVDDPETLKGLSIAAVWGFSFSELKARGEVWKIAEPKEGTTGWVDNFMISHTIANDSKKIRVAEEWLNFVLSDAYQAYVVRGLACSPVTTTVNASLTPEEIENFHLDDPTHFEKNMILWPVLDKTDRKGLERLWDMALSQRK